MYKKSAVHYIAKAVVDILFYLSLLCTAAVPFVARWVFGWIGYTDNRYLILFSAVIFLSGIGCAYILFCLKQMYKTLLVGNPFIASNVEQLRRIAVACAMIAVLYVAKSVIAFTFAAMVISFVFIVGSLFCLTLKDLFKQAINYKTENELTI